jgi:hypothetical protein
LGQNEANEMVSKLMKERETYREKLRIAKSAIKFQSDQIFKLNNQENVNQLDMANSRIHLAFLFSSPLIRKSNNSLENIMQLDYIKEINDIVK